MAGPHPGANPAGHALYPGQVALPGPRVALLPADGAAQERQLRALRRARSAGLLLRRIREAILRNPDEFEAALSDPELRERFQMLGEDYRRMEPPVALPPYADALYRKKGVYFEHDDGLDGRVFSPRYAEEIAEGFRLLRPVYALLAPLAQGE